MKFIQAILFISLIVGGCGTSEEVQKDNVVNVQASEIKIHKPIALPDFSALIDSLKAAVRYECQTQQLPSLSVALLDREKVAWHTGFTWSKDKGSEALPQQAYYQMGEQAYLLTAHLLHEAVKAGKLSMNDPVNLYLPEVVPTTSLKIRHLIQPDSGIAILLPEGNRYSSPPNSLETAVKSLDFSGKVSETSWQETDFFVLGYLLEKLYRKKYTALLVEFAHKHNIANLFTEVSDSIRKHVLPGSFWTYEGRNVSLPVPEATLGLPHELCTDVQSWARCLQILLPAFSENPFWQVMFPVSDTSIWQSSGSGYTSFYRFHPVQQWGIVLLSSLEGSEGAMAKVADYVFTQMQRLEAGQAMTAYPRSLPVNREKIRLVQGRFQQGAEVLSLERFYRKWFVWKNNRRVELRQSGDSLIVDGRLAFGERFFLLNKDTLQSNGESWIRVPPRRPEKVPGEWKHLIGEYGTKQPYWRILEKNGQLYALIDHFHLFPLQKLNEDAFLIKEHDWTLSFTKNSKGGVEAIRLGEVVLSKRNKGLQEAKYFKIALSKPLSEIREIAFNALPPEEAGSFREPELVELSKVIPNVKYDIRYSKSNNFMGVPFYTLERAFLQRPAVQALAKVAKVLERQGLGLLIHDAYRPWYVTKMFWEGAAPVHRRYLANPAKGSRHNRGCAVDLSLYDLKSGKPVEMVSGYDEFSIRAYALYPGGTEQQRWHRDLLRQVMTAYGFVSIKNEWWHFDYYQWKKYPILNLRFEELEKNAG
ncbi:M15 family metallopeptidase [Rapidithrix thailandica]|uniref:D-alanyl-D-alanine dipeptidase n=1 Tax=Rapidithrix thailandica TaxID=413964 RepID=A0AAW9SDK2_9BACT